MKNYFWFLVLGLSLSACATDPAPPASATSAAAPNAPLRVGISPVFPPMAFKQGRELMGVEVDLARALGERLNRKVVFVELPWKNQIDALNDGKTDIIMSSMSITPARRYVVNFTRPYYVVAQMALVRREDKNKYLIGIPLNLPGPIGVVSATTGDYLVQRDFTVAKRKTYADGDDAAVALRKKKIAMFIGDSTSVCYLAGIYANDGLAVVPLALNEESLGWAVRKSDDALLAQANGFITQAINDGALVKVFSRWTAANE